MNNLRKRAEFNGCYLKQYERTFPPRYIVNLYIVCELERYSQDLNTDFTLKGCLFEAVKFTKNADPDKYSSSGHSIGFHSHSLFSCSNFDWGKNVNFGVDNNSSVHIDNKKKNVLGLSKGPTQRLDVTMITAEAIILMNFSKSGRKFCSSLQYNGNKRFFYLLMPQKYTNSK